MNKLAIDTFYTLEALQEHCNMLWGWYEKQGYEWGLEIKDGQRIIEGGVGDFDHELHVIERYAQEILNNLAKLFPEEYENS